MARNEPELPWLLGFLATQHAVPVLARSSQVGGGGMTTSPSCSIIRKSSPTVLRASSTVCMSTVLMVGRHNLPCRVLSKPLMVKSRGTRKPASRKSMITLAACMSLRQAMCVTSRRRSGSVHVSRKRRHALSSASGCKESVCSFFDGASSSQRCLKAENLSR